MDFLTIDNLGLFIILFLPGFVSVKVYHQLVANEKYDFSKNLLEIVGFSLFNLLFNFWLVLLNLNRGWVYDNNLGFFVSCLWILLVAPVLYPIVAKYLLEPSRLGKYFIGHTKQPWDVHFSKRKPYWVIVKLNSGELIGGQFGKNSHASVYPCAESIYIQEVWEMEGERKFIRLKSRSGGMLILANTIQSVEFIN
jgi:hypothetical protein